MTDYAAAAPVQPIVQGVVTFPNGLGTNPVVFDGKGVLPIVTRGASAQGSFILTLDEGLPGNAGAVPAVGLTPPPLPPDPDVRTVITCLAGPVPPPLSDISAIGVTYITSPVPGVGAFQIEVVTTNIAFLPTDPAGGFMIVVWRGQGFQGLVA